MNLSMLVNPFTRHSIWSLASLGTKSHGARERFTNIYMVVHHSKCEMHADFIMPIRLCHFACV